ncbi:MAG: SH3 domain-containing protein, partial [Treponema sp.]|nr:SH3 domain-containing protein [Treponema sp.]
FLDVFSSPYIKYYGEVVRGKINDTNVRLRETPSLDGKIICLLKTGTNVRLNARTKEEQAIGNMKSLWYNISVQDNYGNDVSGWMYGAYLDIEKPEK